MTKSEVFTPQVEAMLSKAVGVSLRIEVGPYLEFATVDGIRNFARAYGDDNPLFGDEAYAARTRHAGVIAPPLFPIATGTPERSDDAVRLASLLGEVGARSISVTGDEWFFHRPIVPGVRLTRSDVLDRVRRSDDGCLVTTVRSTYHQDGVVFAVHDRERTHGDVGLGEPERRTKAAYSAAEIDEIDGLYAAQSRRGGTKRFVDDVELGDRLGPIVKGPLTLTDLVCYRAGVGPGPFGVEPLRLGWKNRQERPWFYDRNELGFHDARERYHWDENFAQANGYPSAYDYSHTRLAWATELLTNWAGDDGWIESINFRLLGMNFVGDTTWISGEISEIDRTASIVTVDYTGINQHGTQSCAGTALVRLLSRTSA